ncbi:hypothetical protein J5500_03695 [Candidatus Saccharibacteria bacterium]|nr:hypothetical protein [Candidatus Saccharibacteria bacterium]
MANRYFGSFSDGSDQIETVAGIAAGATDTIINDAHDNRDQMIGAYAEGTNRLAEMIRCLMGHKAIWYIVLMTILAVGFGLLMFWITGLPLFQAQVVDQVTNMVTGTARNAWTYFLCPILGFAFWVFFIYVTNLGTVKEPEHR